MTSTHLTPDWTPKPEEETDEEDTRLIQTPPVLVWEADRLGPETLLDYLINVCFLPGGEVAVAEASHGVHLFDVTGNPKLTLSRQTLSDKLRMKKRLDPESVTMTQDGHLAISDASSRRIKIYTVDGKHVLSVCKGWFQSPCGVAQFSDGTWVITDPHMHRFHMVPARGRTAETFGSPGSGDKEFNWPEYVAIDDRLGRIIVSDMFNHSIKLFDLRGTFLYSFGGQGWKDGNLDEPHGVCVDQNSFILVADWGNKRISKFQADGTFIQHILELDWQPWGVAVNRLGNLAVCGRGIVQVYKAGPYINSQPQEKPI